MESSTADRAMLALAGTMYVALIAFTRWEALVRLLSMDAAAGWAQAVLSASAIFASVWLSDRQHLREARRRDREASLEIARALQDAKRLLDMADEQLARAQAQSSCIGAARAYYGTHKWHALFAATAHIEALAAYPAARLPDGELFATFVLATKAAQGFQTMVPELQAITQQSAADGPDGSMEEQRYWKQVQWRIRDYRDRIRHASGVFDKAVANRLATLATS